MTGSVNYRGSLGLAGFRQKKGISLEDIAQATKISVRSLQAIEKGEFQKLPGGIYSTNYIRQYARYVECDESEILADYYAKMGPAANPTHSEPEPRRASLRLWPSALFGNSQ